MGLLSILSLVWGALGYPWNGNCYYPLSGITELPQYSVRNLWIAFQCPCYYRVIEERTRCCWLYPVCRRHFLRCHPPRFRLRDFLRFHSCSAFRRSEFYSRCLLSVGASFTRDAYSRCLLSVGASFTRDFCRSEFYSRCSIL